MTREPDLSSLTAGSRTGDAIFTYSHILGTGSYRVPPNPINIKSFVELDAVCCQMRRVPQRAANCSEQSELPNAANTFAEGRIPDGRRTSVTNCRDWASGTDHLSDHRPPPPSP